jgi:hypothetical protein
VSEGANLNIKVLDLHFRAGVSTCCGRGPQPLFWAGSRAALVKNIIILNHLNSYAVLIVYIYMEPG